MTNFDHRTDHVTPTLTTLTCGSVFISWTLIFIAFAPWSHIISFALFKAIIMFMQAGFLI